MLSDQLHVQSEGAGQQRGFALTTQSSCPLHQSGWTRLSCGKEKHRVKSLNPSSLKGIFDTGLCFFGLTWYLLHAFYSFRPLSLEWTVLYNVISEHTNILWAGVKRTGADSLQWYPATGQGVTGTNWNTGHSTWVWGKKTCLLWWRQSTETGSSERLWSLRLQRHSKPTQTWSCATCCRWAYFTRKVGLDNLWRSLFTPALLWFPDTKGDDGHLSAKTHMLWK